jgi:GH15 family glucan-1,4-alpha-glucosidase
MIDTQADFSTTDDPDSTQRPIADNALIGDLRTASVIGGDGTVCFCCLPTFDSPAVFASLLDPHAGHFRVRPSTGGFRITQMYLPDTNVLLTRFLSDEGIAELTDAMPVVGQAGPQRLLRRIAVIRGEVPFDMLCAPRFGYATVKHTLKQDGGGGIFRPETGPVLRLRSSLPTEIRPNDAGGDLGARFTLKAGEAACFALEVDPTPDDADGDLSQDEFQDVFQATFDWWHAWVRRIRYRGRWREMVTRSALIMKMMISAEHGAMVAAPTFGLPELPGGERNWDYRYCWIRDTSFAMYAFVRLGLVEEVEAFVDWIDARVYESTRIGGSDPLRIMYTLGGGTELTERTLDNFGGWKDSRPVRIGNGAADQFQLDIYGELMDAIYLANKYGRGSSYENWQDVCRIITWLSSNWGRPDQGIWEGRGAGKHFLHSRMMCWVALDRAIRLAQERSLPAPLPEWNSIRMQIYNSIHQEFWNADLNSFVQYPGATTPDGSMLLMPLMRFISPQDPRWLGTLALIERTLVDDALVHRRTAADRVLDGLTGEEGSFLACSFWYVECLARGGQVARARLLFEKLLAYGNHLGLFSEELSASGRHLGNTPQVLTHLALISAAAYLDRALSGEQPPPWT